MVARRDTDSMPAPGAHTERPRLQALPRSVDTPDQDDEPMGGDPACWLHLFEDAEDNVPPNQ